MSQRTSSITTRIKTTMIAPPFDIPSISRDHHPLQQGLRLIHFRYSIVFKSYSQRTSITTRIKTDSPVELTNRLNPLRESSITTRIKTMCPSSTQFGSYLSENIIHYNKELRLFVFIFVRIKACERTSSIANKD
jgi:hypothetical protein